jgi:hypothetical protein
MFLCFAIRVDSQSSRTLASGHMRQCVSVPYSDAKSGESQRRDFGWEIAHEAVSRHPPISINTIVARTHMYTHDANVWDLSIVQGPFSCCPRAKP